MGEVGAILISIIVLLIAVPALVVAVSGEGQVTIRQAKDGKEVMHFKIAAGSYAAPVYFNDILYICEPYKVSAYGPVSALGLIP